jgi:hypothetical protein
LVHCRLIGARLEFTEVLAQVRLVDAAASSGSCAQHNAC